MAEVADETIYFVPTNLRPVVYVPVGGYSFGEMLTAMQNAVTEVYVQAAKRGQVAVVKTSKPNPRANS